MELLSRFLKDPKKSFFLLGPRGTGKSTWAQAIFKEALRIDLLEPETFRRYSAKPERLRELVQGHPERQVVVIDEIQKVPALLSVVHSLIEEKRGYQIIMTGSSARKRWTLSSMGLMVSGRLKSRIPTAHEMRICEACELLGRTIPRRKRCSCTEDESV